MNSQVSVLYLTKYDQMGASSRYRFFQYFPLLEAAGISCSAAPLFDNDCLARRYAMGKVGWHDLCRALWRRLKALVTARSYSLLVIEYELIPYAPALLERALSFLGVPYIVEYDDAIFDHYERSRFWPIKTFLARKIAVVMRKSRLVVAGNGYLADYAARSGARRVEILPTVIDLERYPAGSPVKRGGFTIGWIGSPSTGRYLSAIAPSLAAVCRERRGKVVLIGSGPVELPGVPVEILPWSAQSEVEQISRFDVGIMPLPESNWALGKCGFKLIQYMGCSLPVVASPVGANRDIVREEVNGLLAQSPEEWIGALERLQGDRALGLRMGRAGRELVEKQYCKQVTGPRLISLIQSVAGEPR
jgi:glycosyltransferase involved in cell wall biosynthesis